MDKNNTVFILVFIDDEYGRKDFQGVFHSRKSGEIAFENHPRKVYHPTLYSSLEEFDQKNGCNGFVLLEEEIK